MKILSFVKHRLKSDYSNMTWIQKDGTEIRVKEMTWKHIENSIQMLQLKLNQPDFTLRNDRAFGPSLSFLSSEKAKAKEAVRIFKHVLAVRSIPVNLE